MLAKPPTAQANGAASIFQLKARPGPSSSAAAPADVLNKGLLGIKSAAPPSFPTPPRQAGMAAPPPPPGSLLKDEGNAHYRSGNFAAAEDCYNRALAEPGAQWLAASSRARLVSPCEEKSCPLVVMSLGAAAVSSITMLPAGANLEVLHLNRSAARLGLRDWVGAERDAAEALKQAEAAGRPGSWKAWLRRGIAHRQQMYSAKADLRKALQLAPAEMKRRVAAELPFAQLCHDADGARQHCSGVRAAGRAGPPPRPAYLTG